MFRALRSLQLLREGPNRSRAAESIPSGLDGREGINLCVIHPNRPLTEES